MQSHAKFLELHYVLSESSCFVREDIVDSAKLLIQVATLNLCRQVFFIVVDHPILFDKVALNELNHL